MKLKQYLCVVLSAIMMLFTVPAAVFADGYCSLKELAKVNGYEYFYYDSTVNLRNSVYIISFKHGSATVNCKTLFGDNLIYLDNPVRNAGDDLYLSQEDRANYLSEYFPKSASTMIGGFSSDIYVPTSPEPTLTPITSITMKVYNPFMTINGEKTPIRMDSYKNTADENAVPIVKDGRTLVPIRAFVEAIGGMVDWDGNTQTVTLTHKDRTIKLKINDKSAVVNGKPITLDVAPQVINDLTKMPIRFIAETFGFDVAWDRLTMTITITPEYDTFDNIINYSSFFYNNGNFAVLKEALSLSYDGEYYYYVSEADGKAYRYNNSNNEEIKFNVYDFDFTNQNRYISANGKVYRYNNSYNEEMKFNDAKGEINGNIDNMRVFKNNLIGIIQEDENDEGRAFISNTDGSNFNYFAVRTGGARDYSSNIITRNEDGKNYIYLLDSSDQQSYLRKFELNGDTLTEVEGRVFDRRLYAYSITDDYEMYTDYPGFALHCIRRSDNKDMALGFSAYRLNNDHEDFFTFKKRNETQYTPCRITKDSLDTAFAYNNTPTVDTAENTNSPKRLTVTKDKDNKTHVLYFDNTLYQEILFD